MTKLGLVILAAGNSTRFNAAGPPKQYMPILGDKTMLALVIEKFASHQHIDYIQPVISEAHKELFTKSLEQIIPIYRKQILPPVIGGKTRQDSVYSGLKALENYKPDKILIHDAARPHFSSKLLHSIIEAIYKYQAVIPVVGVTDTIKIVNQLGTVNQTVARQNCFAAQTPQAFDFSLIYQLHKEIKTDNIVYTDDASICEAKGIEVYTIAGEAENYKVTYMRDYINMIKQGYYRVGNGIDIHRFITEEQGDYHIILGGVKIPSRYKIEAHSDGDVLIHALVDAILGALGEGDIGEYFPPSEEKWRGADSMIFLEHVLGLLARRQAVIENIDITIIAERPKLLAYKNQIKMNLAEFIACQESQINVKATTSEKLGFTGRGEGILAQVTVLIKGIK